MASRFLFFSSEVNLHYDDTTPMLEFGSTSTLSFDDKLAVLHTDVKEGSIANNAPFRIEGNGSFVIDTKRTRKDWKTMDNGSFKHNGLHGRIYEIDGDECRSRTKRRASGICCGLVR